MSSSNTVLISKRIDKNYKTQRFSFAHTYAIVINKGHLKIFYAICRLTFTLFPTDPVDDEWRKESIIGKSTQWEENAWMQTKEMEALNQSKLRYV